MPKKPFVINSEFPYHLSARSNGRDWFAVDTEIVWEIFSNYLHFVHHAFGVRIHSFVLMNNHFHLIASFPEGNLSAALMYLMRESSKVIGFESRRINHVFGGRTFRSCLATPLYFEHAYKYVYRNPVEAGICRRVEDYPFSTLHGILGSTHSTIPVEEDTLMFDRDTTENLNWLNTAPPEEDRLAIQKGLRRDVFQLPNTKSSNRAHSLENARY